MANEFPFDVVCHKVPVFSTRQYSHAILDEKKDLYVAVKQYIPRYERSSTTPAPDPITIVAAGGLGFIKELYEPLFIELLSRTRNTPLRIRSIWIADMFNTGQSAVDNADQLGCDPAWMDHVRDLWCVVTRFQKDMIRPIVGLGHSMGCNQLLYLSHWHPRLFHSLAFIEAGVDPEYGKGITMPWMLQTLHRKDSFSRREEAEADLMKAHMASSWNKDVIKRLKTHGVHAYCVNGKIVWRATTPKQQIATLVSRFNPGLVGLGASGIDGVTLKQRQQVPDSDPLAWNAGPFYRAELKGAWDLLPHVRPWVLYVNGGKSPFFGRPRTREERARLTGTGVGGSGGMKLGAVKQVIVEGGEHTMVFDQDLYEVASQVADWLLQEDQRWEDVEKTQLRTWQAESLRKKQNVSQAFVDALVCEVKDMKKLKRSKL